MTEETRSIVVLVLAVVSIGLVAVGCRSLALRWLEKRRQRGPEA